MSCLAVIAANMSHRMAVAAERSSHDAEAAWRTCHAVDAADWSGQRDLLRAKFIGSAKQQEQTIALLKWIGIIVEKLMDENNKLLIECRRLVEDAVDALKQHLEDKKELIAARRGD